MDFIALVYTENQRPYKWAAESGESVTSLWNVEMSQGTGISPGITGDHKESIPKPFRQKDFHKDSILEKFPILLDLPTQGSNPDTTL